MKILEAKFERIEDDLWTVVSVRMEHQGQEYSGFLLFENDGRDLEVEGFDPPLPPDWLSGLWAGEHGDHNVQLLEPALEEGCRQYEQN